MEDESLMPFGPHKGKKLANVPARYLLSLYKQPDLDKELKFYIKDNLDVLRFEINQNTKVVDELEEFYDY